MRPISPSNQQRPKLGDAPESMHFMKRPPRMRSKELLRGLARVLSLAFAMTCSLALIAESSGCRASLPSRPLSDVVRDEAGMPIAAPTSSGAFDDDLSGGFFFGTKCATIRVRPMSWATGARISPPAASIERVANELP